MESYRKGLVMVPRSPPGTSHPARDPRASKRRDPPHQSDPRKRGEGRWFSLATGLKDPLGRTGAVTALQAGLARWWAEAAAR